MLEKFTEKLEDLNLLNSQVEILLAVSGGVDSIVLLELIQKIAKELRPQISIAHINHQLRVEANQEENFVKRIAEKYGIPFYIYHWDKKSHPSNGIEKAAREIRYGFFKETMNDNNIPVLMTGHHQDDQVETILMRLARGSSLKQLTGIREIRSFNNGQLIRPLLTFSKTEIYHFAKENNLKYFEDESNEELVYTRNRFRKQIIPLLQKENERFNEHIVQFSSDIDDLLQVNEETIRTFYQEIIKEKSNKIKLDITKYSNYEGHIQRMILLQLLKKLYQNERESYKTNYIELIHNWLIEGEVNSKLNLQSGLIAEKKYTTVIFSKKICKHQKTIDLNEFYTIKELNKWIKISEDESIGLFKAENKDLKHKKHSLLIDEEALCLPFKIRHRMPGDRMNYKGLKGTKKIKDIFIDEKTPLNERDQAWLVENKRKEIIWLIPYRKMDLFTELETDKITYVLKYKKD